LNITGERDSVTLAPDITASFNKIISKKQPSEYDAKDKSEMLLIYVAMSRAIVKLNGADEILAQTDKLLESSQNQP